MEIVLCRVTAQQKDTLFRLLQYSLYEESGTDGNVIGEDGLFVYPWFDAYFAEPDREAYLIREEGTNRLLGFCMINTYTKIQKAGHSIAEFMVLPGCRRAGVGAKAAMRCFKRHSGYWEVSPSRGSDAAYAFWKKTINAYTDGDCEWSQGTFSFTR